MNQNKIVSTVLILSIILAGAVIFLSFDYDVRRTPFADREEFNIIRTCYKKYPECVKFKEDGSYYFSHFTCPDMCLNNYNTGDSIKRFRKLYGSENLNKADEICKNIKGNCNFREYEKIIRSVSSEGDAK